jgi:hypothetical protein
MIKKPGIIIPIYQENPNELEMASLKQCIEILGFYDLIFVTSSSLNTQKYTDLLSKLGQPAKFEYFKNYFFEHIKGYNQLLISKQFYKRFKPYEYILIYQLDAWVFKDELKFWCNQGYDYVGAPWYEGYTFAKENSKFIGVGNGGFSLRKITTHLKVLNSFSYIHNPKNLAKEIIKKSGFKPRTIIEILLNFTFRNNTFFLFNTFKENEDYFWCFFVKKNYQWFNIPEENVAAKFATEKKAAIHYEKNKGNLPFGCHAWLKYETEFWKKHIKLSDDF